MKTFSWTMTIQMPDVLSRALSPSVRFLKETRVILPALLLGSLLGVLAVFAMRTGEFINGTSITGTFTLLLYPLTCSAIGALAFGHDYIHRTLGSFLSLPISRSRIWFLRLWISFLAMLPLIVLQIASFNALTLWALLSGHTVIMASDWQQSLFAEAQSAAVPMLSGLFLAPWLTLVSRSPLFGTIVSMVLPFLLGLISTSVLVASGFDRTDTPWHQLRLIPMTLLSIVFGTLGWRKFRNLEVIDGEIGVASRSSVTAVGARKQLKRRSATVQLIKKDFMLLRMPLALAVAGMLLTLFLNKDQAALWTLVYPAMTVLLIGAVSTADERQLGVSEWQVLMPIAFWKQWTIKFLVAWLTALIVGLALPIGVLYLKTGDWQHIEGRDFAQVIPVFIAASFEFVAFTVYVSSLCNSGLKALIAAILVNISAAYMMIRFFEAYSKLLSADGIEATVWWTDWRFWPVLMAFFGMAALALLLAMRNHRYTERGAPRLIRQLSAFAAYEVGAVIAVTMFWNWYSWLR